MQRHFFDSLQVLVFPDKKQMGKFAAAEAAAAIRMLAEEQDEISILFAAAPSQDDFLSALVMEENIPWERVNAFQLDDYIGIQADAPQRFANYLKRNIFDAIPLKNIFLINCENTDTRKEVERYTLEIKAHSADIAFIGIGENGHVAFNDPGIADVYDSLLVREVLMDERSRIQQVNDGCFDRLELVPRSAITLTIPPIMACKRIFCIVPGKSKAQAVYDTLYEEFDNMHPSTILRSSKKTTLYLDRDSASMLNL